MGQRFHLTNVINKISPTSLNQETREASTRSFDDLKTPLLKTSRSNNVVEFGCTIKTKVLTEKATS